MQITKPILTGMALLAGLSLTACTGGHQYGYNGQSYGGQTGYQYSNTANSAYYGQSHTTGYGAAQSRGYTTHYAHKPAATTYGTPVLRGQAPYSRTVNHAGAYHHGPHSHYGMPSNKGFYGNLGLVAYDAGEDIYGIQARLGYDFNDMFAAEAEGSIGVVDEDLGGIDVGVDHQLGIFGKLKTPISDRVTAHARLGYATTKVAAGPFDTNVDGVAYGIGAEFATSPVSAIRLDYTQYEFDNAGSTDNISAAYVRKF